MGLGQIRRASREGGRNMWRTEKLQPGCWAGLEEVGRGRAGGETDRGRDGEGFGLGKFCGVWVVGVGCIVFERMGWVKAARGRENVGFGLEFICGLGCNGL